MIKVLVLICLMAAIPAAARGQGVTRSTTEPAPAAAGIKRVLVLYSTTRDSLLGGVGDHELSRLLDNGLSQQLDYYTEYIDLGRFPDQRYRAGFREFLRVKYPRNSALRRRDRDRRGLNRIREPESG